MMLNKEVSDLQKVSHAGGVKSGSITASGICFYRFYSFSLNGLPLGAMNTDVASLVRP